MKLGMGTRIAAIAVLLGLLYAVYFGIDRRAYLRGKVEVQARWEADKLDLQAAHNAALLARIQENDQAAKQAELDRQRLKKGHADEIAYIRSRYAADRGLRVNANLCAGFAAAGQAEGTGRGDGGASGTWLLPEPYSGNLERLMLEADTIVAGCRVAQQFLSEQGMAP